MRGTVRKVSQPRRVIIDLMHASLKQPHVSVRRTLNIGPLVAARKAASSRPGWSAIFAKAFSIIARDDAVFRTYYLKWPWPHFYELPKSSLMLAIARDDIEQDAIHFLKVGSPDQLSLNEIEQVIAHGRQAPLDEIPSLRRMLQVSRLPMPLRRLVWATVLNIGRQRANHAGTFSITSVASLGAESTLTLFPGPYLISYGLLKPDSTMEILFHWDHRVCDGIRVAHALTRMEEIMNAEIAREVSAPQITGAN